MIQRTFNKITPKRGNPVHSDKKGVKSESQARAKKTSLSFPFFRSLQSSVDDRD